MSTASFPLWRATLAAVDGHAGNYAQQTACIDLGTIQDVAGAPAYFWPVVGEQDEICFLYYPSRAAKRVETTLGLLRPDGAVLRSDGDSAYAHYANKTGITHAQCWAHARRKIFDARDVEPAQADQALHAIATLYKVEQQIRDDGLTGQAKLACRQERSKRAFERFFAWIDEQFDTRGFCRAVPSLAHRHLAVSAGAACRSTLTIQRYRSTRTISSARRG